MNIGNLIDRDFKSQAFECAYIGHERKVRVGDEKGDKEIAKNQRLLQASARK